MGTKYKISITSWSFRFAAVCSSFYDVIDSTVALFAIVPAISQTMCAVVRLRALIHCRNVNTERNFILMS